MRRSLSILLPVHNVQATLASHVGQVLEIAGELTDRLEVLIIDNGSSDLTFEVAHSLAVRYPQVQVMRYNERRSFQQVVRSALKRTSADVILAHRHEKAPSRRGLVAIRHLWTLPDDVERRSGLGQDVGASQHGWQVLDQQALPGLSVRADGATARRQPPRPNFLAKLRDFTLGE